MLDKLGKKRVVILASLALLNAALLVWIYTALQPQITNENRQLSSLRGQVNEQRQELEAARAQFEILDQQSEKFSELQQGGFFTVQDGGKSRDLLQKIEELSNVKATAVIDSRRFVEDEDAEKAGYVLMEAPMNINIEAINDIDVYKYIYLLENYFPGHLTVEDIQLSRERSVDGPILRSIASGEKPVLVRATVRLTWRTMIDEAKRNEL